MVLMVTFPLCAGVSVHFKNPDFAYFGAYIPHFCVFVIGDIYRVKREYLREYLTGSYVMHFTMQEFPDRTIVLTVEQTCYGWLSVGGVWGV